MPKRRVLTIFLFARFLMFIATSRRVNVNSRPSQSKLGSALRLRPGDVFVKRFELTELMFTEPATSGTWASTSASSLLEHDRSIPLPNAVRNKYEQPPEYLSKGSFGETWKAYDTHMQSYVAVKMLYTGNRHMSWAKDRHNRQMELEQASHECSLAQMMQMEAQKDPKGASRLMRCLEDHVGSQPRNSHNPLYLVLEFCGNNDLRTFIENRFKQDSLTMAELQSLWEQLNEGLNFMTNDAHTRRWVHHDLKSANIVVDDTQGHDTPLLKIIDFGSVTQAPAHAMDKPGSIGGGRNPIVATPIYAPYELREPLVNGRYCYPWYSFDMFSAASTFVEMLSMHPWTELLSWQCYIKTFDDIKNRGGKNPLDTAVQVCQRKLHDILLQAQPQVEDINPKLATDYWGRAAIQRLRRLIKISAVIHAHYNRRVADGRPEDARQKYFQDLQLAMSAREEDLDHQLATMLPNRMALIHEIFDDYRSNESEPLNKVPMRDFVLSLISSLSPYASERISPFGFITKHQGYRLSQDFATPNDVHFKAKVVPCEPTVLDSCVLHGILGGSDCPAHSTCVQTNGTALIGAFSKKCICDPGYCVVANECVLSDPPVLFEKHDGANAVQQDLHLGERSFTSTLEKCEEVAATSEAYLYTYFSLSFVDEDLRGMCVTWNYDIAETLNRLYVSSFDFSEGELASDGVLTGVNVELYVPEPKPVTQENTNVNVAGEVYAMQNGFLGPPKGPVRYRMHNTHRQKVVGYRQ